MAKVPPDGSPLPSFIAGQIREYRYFFLNLAPISRGGLAVACGGWERCAADYRVNRSDLKFYGLEYVAQGKGVLTMNGVETRLLPGSIFTYQPLTAHSIQTDPKDPLVKYFIDFSGRGARKIAPRKIMGPDGVGYLTNAQPIHDLYEQMLEIGTRGGSLAPRYCRLLLELISLRIEENSRVPCAEHSRARQSFERCRRELQRRFRTLQSVSELAALTHMDPAYLSRLFDRFVGENPHEMLTRLKMNEAASHLMGGRYSVKEVATLIGFSDPYHFSRVFKKRWGIPPAHFQRDRSH